MFFKNLTAFKITDINIDIFEDSMNKLAFTPCSNSQKSSRGFTNPFIKDEQCLLSLIIWLHFVYLLKKNSSCSSYQPTSTGIYSRVRAY